MSEWLSRGKEINGITTGRLINYSTSWQLYETSNQGHCLAVSPRLYEKWRHNYDIPENFFYSIDYSCYAIVSAGNMLITSLSSGPYTKDLDLIELVAIACKDSLLLYGDDCLNDSIVICDFGMVLPTGNSSDKKTFKSIFRTWLSGGVNIPDDMPDDDFYNLVSWLSLQEYAYVMGKAGIAISITNIDSQRQGESEFNIPAEPFSLPGRRSLCAFLNENIVDVLRNYSEYRRMGFDFPSGTILYGPPGSGKTYAIERLSEYLKFPRYDLTADSVASPYIHDTSKKIAAIFKEAKDNAPSILVIDEMEAFLSSRGNVGSNKYHLEETAEFLRGLPQLISSHVLVFGMTNLLDSLDEAIIRRGRFDYKIEITLADQEDILEVLKKTLSSLPVESNIDYDWLSRKLAERPLSDVSFVIREAGRISIKEKKRTIETEAFISAIDKLESSELEKNNPIGFRFD